MSTDDKSAEQGLPLSPDYMRDLVDRAATQLKAQWPCTAVKFQLWADGEDRSYTARLDWSMQESAPRVIVFDGRSGDFICQSLEGQFFDIDPVTWCGDAVPDEVARDEWEQKQRKRGGKA